MLFAIDAGNTNTVFALFDGEKLVDSWRLQTQNGRSSDEYGVFLHHILGLTGIAPKAVSSVLISSVVPETNFHMTGFCEKYLEIAPKFVTKNTVPIGLDVERPEDVGADRLVNAVAAKNLYQSPAVILDFGTATTFDLLNADGKYAGGVIAPGVNLSLNALHQAASKLPRVSIQKPGSVVGKTTVQAMRSGIYWGYLSMIEGVLTRMTDEIEGEPIVIATGGLASLFAKDIAQIKVVDDDLTLKGLYEIHKYLESH